MFQTIWKKSFGNIISLQNVSAVPVQVCSKDTVDYLVFQYKMLSETKCLNGWDYGSILCYLLVNSRILHPCMLLLLMDENSQLRIITMPFDKSFEIGAWTCLNQATLLLLFHKLEALSFCHSQLHTSSVSTMECIFCYLFTLLQANTFYNSGKTEKLLVHIL